MPRLIERLRPALRLPRVSGACQNAQGGALSESPSRRGGLRPPLTMRSQWEADCLRELAYRGHRRPEVAAPCVDETMKPTSESLSPSVTWNRRVAECYCGAAMRRGELHKANDQPQTQVNSIRPGRLASRRRGGMRPRGWVPCEACGYGHTPSSDIARSMLTGGDVRVSGVRMARRLHGLNQDPCGEQEPAAGGRALTVAMKRLITVEREGVGR